jgi:hypothetical protein
MNWNTFQADKGSAAMFCPVPDARRERLKKQIVVFKSLWNLSSDLRARRLLDILVNNSIDRAGVCDPVADGIAAKE